MRQVATTSLTLSELSAHVGEPLGTSRVVAVEQDRVDRFADATEDRQWIHVDPDRAAAGPFGGTIAHGFLTLSLGTSLLWDVLEVSDATQIINYGLNKVRFPAPLPVGSLLKMSVVLLSVEDVRGGLQATMQWTFEIEGGTRPVCVAEVLFRYYAGTEGKKS